MPALMASTIIITTYQPWRLAGLDTTTTDTDTDTDTDTPPILLLGFGDSGFSLYTSLFFYFFNQHC
jgi:hypothetical protein